MKKKREFLTSKKSKAISLIVKEKSNLSGKKWDKTIKSLVKKNLAK